MRHLATLIAAVFVAPLSWLLLAAGQDGSTQAFAHAQNTGAFNGADFVQPVISLAGTGLILGFLSTVRFSPLGAVLVGGAYAAGYLGLLFDPDGVLGLFPARLSVAGRSIDPSTPIRTGTALLLGALLVMATVSVGRRRPSATEPAHRAPAEGPRTESPGAERTRTSRPAPTIEPEPMSHYAGSSSPGNRGPRSYAFVDNSIDRWVLNSKAPWPYAQRP